MFDVNVCENLKRKVHLVANSKETETPALLTHSSVDYQDFERTALLMTNKMDLWYCHVIPKMHS